jgi:hypothetical protein
MPSRNAWMRAIIVASILPAAAPSFGQPGQHEAERQIRAHARMGETIRLRGHVNYVRNCAEVVATTISVAQPPQHGTLDVRDEVVRSTNPELGTGSKCAGAHGMGKVVYYTRTSPGADAFAYDSISTSGVVHLHVAVQ